MLLIDDRTLLSIESSVFVLASGSAVTLVSAADISVSGTMLASNAVDFEAAGIDQGHVAVVNGIAVEIVQRAQPTALNVSRPRVSEADSPIPPGDGENLTLQVLTFEKLIERVQAEVLTSLGVRADDPVQPLDEAAIVNAEAVGHVIGLQTIERAFAAASAASPADAALAALASLYARLARRASQQLVAVIDTNADGQPDASRWLGVVHLIRN